MQLVSDCAVSCRGVTKTYGSANTQVSALRGINLEVHKGELLMLVGPSGCGKTTLISIIAGILDHDAGDCLVFGNNLQAMGAHAKTEYRRQHIGFVFQAYNLLPVLTTTENVAVPLLINGIERREALRQAQDMLAQVGLGDRIHAFPPQLSGGQQQRVAVARALIHQPDLIVCDEPTSALDHDTGQRIMDLLRTLALQANRALVIVTHDARIFTYADRLAVLHDGRIEKVVQSVDGL
jgi:putative ABC transport system ATP-binding protein